MYAAEAYHYITTENERKDLTEAIQNSLNQYFET